MISVSPSSPRSRRSSPEVRRSGLNGRSQTLNESSGCTITVTQDMERTSPTPSRSRRRSSFLDIDSATWEAVTSSSAQRPFRFLRSLSPSSSPGNGGFLPIGSGSHSGHGSDDGSSTPSPTPPKNDGSPNLHLRYQDRLILPLGTKEIDFCVPSTTLSPLTPTFARKSGDSSPSGSKGDTEVGSRGSNSPSPVFFHHRGSPNSSSTAVAFSGDLSGINPELYKSAKEVESDGEDGDPWPPNHRGRVWFSLEYDTGLERLLVTVIKAKNLPVRPSSSPKVNGRASGTDEEAEDGSRTRPELVKTLHCRISLSPDERRTLQSKPRRMSRAMRVNETFGFQVSRKSLEERSLKVCFFEVEEESKRSKMIGYFVQPLKDIDWSLGKQTLNEDLLREDGELSPNIGEVSVSLCYNGCIQRLTVTIFEVKGIKSRESSSGSYAKISLNQNTKICKTKKTATIPLIGGRSEFNESFNFKLTQEALDIASISVQVMYALPGYNKDQAIGGAVVLGPLMFARGKGLEHWQKMLSRPKEQTQEWHTVCE